MLVPQKYSERLGVIEPDQLIEVADRHGLGEVLDAYPPPGGLFGQNIVLETSEGSFVLRGNPYGHAQLTKERRVATFIDEYSSLPAPWPYEVSEEIEPFGWTYAVMPCLPGTPGAELWPSLDPEGRVALARATGEALAWLHEAEAFFVGPYDGQLDDFVEMDDFGDWFLHRLEYWRNLCRAVNALSTEAERYIDQVIDECADALDEPFTPVLVHHDFTVDNLNFDQDDVGFEASGVFDLAEAYLGDGEEDLVRMLWIADTDDQRSAFVDAYTEHWPLRSGASDRLALYALADHLPIWEFARRVGAVDDEEAPFVETVRPVVERARQIGSGA